MSTTERLVLGLRKLRDKLLIQKADTEYWQKIAMLYKQKYEKESLEAGILRGKLNETNYK